MEQELKETLWGFHENDIYLTKLNLNFYAEITTIIELLLKKGIISVNEMEKEYKKNLVEMTKKVLEK